MTKTSGFSTHDVVVVPNRWNPNKTERAIVTGFQRLGYRGQNVVLVLEFEIDGVTMNMHPSHVVEHEGNDPTRLETWASIREERRAHAYDMDWIFSPLRRCNLGGWSHNMLCFMLRQARAGLPETEYVHGTRLDPHPCLEEINTISRFVWNWDHAGWIKHLNELRQSKASDYVI